MCCKVGIIMGAFWNFQWLKAKLNTRLAFVKFYSGIVAALFLLLVFYVSLYFTWSDVPNLWSSSAPTRDFCSFNQTGCAELWQTKLGGRNEAVLVEYLKEWELPEVKEASEAEKIGEVLYGETPLKFVPMGTSSFLFVLFGSYRIGPNSFAVTGLGPKSLHGTEADNVMHPGFSCSWIPTQDSDEKARDEGIVIDGNTTYVINGTAAKYLLKWDIVFEDDKEYIAMTVHCTFDSPIGIDGKGGELKMIATQGQSRNHTHLQNMEFVALEEQPGEYDNFKLQFEAPLYEYVYCGSPLYGSIGTDRVRQWIAYHMRLFGNSSHFFLYDVGGINDQVWKVLKPWVELGRVSITNVRQQARYDAYLYNQFLLANDCLLRAKPLAKWAFYFDIDEYLHVTEGDNDELSFHNLMSQIYDRGRKGINILFPQRPMSYQHCIQNDSLPATVRESQWTIEKLVYRRSVDPNFGFFKSHWHDMKTAIQPKYVLAMGIHNAIHVQPEPGSSTPTSDIDGTISELTGTDEGGQKIGDKMHYYHYHGTTNSDGDPCRQFLDPELNSTVNFEEGEYYIDTTMCSEADAVREFEYQTIGPVLLD